MIRPHAVISISGWALSPQINSRLQLRFGLSNCCPVDTLIFDITSEFGSSSHIIRRSSETKVILEEVSTRSKFADYRIDVTLHDPDPAHALKFMDILSIDGLSLRRGENLLDDE